MRLERRGRAGGAGSDDDEIGLVDTLARDRLLSAHLILPESMALLGSV
jgi:hypothetical protein